MHEVTRKYYYNPQDITNSGYYVIVEEEPVGGYCWAWYDPSEGPDFSGLVYGTITEALKSASKDWSTNGSGGNLSHRLLKAAMAYERQGL